MANGIIPDKLHDFNVYSNANKLIGISGEVKLPELAAMSETLSGPGVMGEIDSPTPGFFSGMEQEIPFRTLYEDMFSLMSPLDAVDITLRGAIQTMTRTTTATTWACAWWSAGSLRSSPPALCSRARRWMPP